MKKLLAIIISLAMILSLAACTVPAPAENNETPSKEAAEKNDDASSEEAAEQKDRLERIREKGYIEVCMEPAWAPSEFIDPTKKGQDQYQGVDIELAKVIADRIGVELKIVPLEFTAVLASISDGKYDLAISALAWTEERAESMLLSDGYFTTEPTQGYGFLVRKEDAEKYIDAETAKDAVIVTQSGSIQESLYKKYIGECKELKLVSSMPDGYLEVVEGKADICICACTTAELYIEANGFDLMCPEYRLPIDMATAGTRVGAPLGDSDSLMEIVNEVIGELNESGQFKEWREYYEAYAKELGV